MLDSRPTIRRRATVGNYIKLTKPRIIELLLVTTVPMMMLAQGGWPSTWLVAATVIGGSLSAGGANVLNMVCDRDIDAEMGRTADRPLVTGEIPVRNALAFGVILGLVGHVWLTATAGGLAAWLTTGALLFYVGIYTMVLKRRTTQNIVIGGVAGAVPVLVGSAAVTGGVSLEAAVLFLVVCLWTPPHFWALAIHYRDDYRGAGVPMLPVVAGVGSTIHQIRIYTVATVAASLLVILGREVGLVYLLPVLATGVWFIVGSIRLTEDRAMAFFRDSIMYLTILFAMVAADALVGTPI